MSGLSALSDSVVGFQRYSPDMSGPQDRHVRALSLIRVSSRVPERWVGHVRPLTQTCLSFWHPNSCFGCLGKTKLSGFYGFKPPDRTYPFTVFSLLSLTHTRTIMRTTLRPPLVIPWSLCGISEFLGEINSPRIGVSVPPTGFSHLKVSSPNS
jgi:hypothetical protein